MSKFITTPKIYKPSLSSLTIESLPFAELGEACKLAEDRSATETIINDFITRYGLSTRTWLYPQILAKIGKWTPVRSSSLFDPKATLAKNCTTPTDIGIYYFLLSNSRALSKQYTKGNSEYCALVPLILSAFKKYQDIPYSSWDRENIHYLVDNNLCTAMLCELMPWTTEELLEYRNLGLTVKSGKSAGTVKSPISTYGITGVPEEIDSKTTISYLPKLAKMMLCQTWCAHPSNRNKYMILDPSDWDNMPEPLVDAEPIKDVKEDYFRDLPWNQ